MIEDFWDLFRVQFPFIYIVIAVPVALTALSPSSQKNTGIVQEFRAYRLQHFDLGGNLKGSRNWRVAFDATALNANALRRCLIVSWKGLASVYSSFQELLPSSLGAVVVVIPDDLRYLSEEDKNAFINMENKFLEKPFNFAIFYAPETPQLNDVLYNVELQKQHEKGTALSTLLSMITANSYHFISETQPSNVLLTSPIYNIMAKLSSFDRSDKIPSILLVAHYDSFGSAPALSFGADSNGSGMVALLEILRILSKLYENTYTRARYNIIFLLSGAGKFNFMGSRQFIDDYTEQLENSNVPTSKIEFAVCLDSLLGSDDDSDDVKNNKLYMHVSKLPRNHTSVDRFYNRLKNSALKRGVGAEIVAKKINLADEYLAWEHERYSMRKLYAFTLSKHASHKSPLRRSILDLNTGSMNQIGGLKQSVRIIAEALTDHVFQLPLVQQDSDKTAGGDDVDNDLSHATFDGLHVDDNFIQSLFDHVTSVPRSAQNMTSRGSFASHNGGGQGHVPKHALLNDLFSVMNQYSNEAHYVPIKLDKRDPEFVLYGYTMDKIFAYRIKPAVFDLILATIIIGYLSLLYLFILNAACLQYKLSRLLNAYMSNGIINNNGNLSTLKKRL